jgi:AcrR family transcriptional regulator
MAARWSTTARLSSRSGLSPQRACDGRRPRDSITGRPQFAGGALISAASEEPFTGPSSSRREDLLRSAASLFAEHGVNGVSINQIAAPLGLSGPAIYRHFESKDAILAQLLLRGSQRLRDSARQLVAAHRPAEAIEALVDFHVKFAIEQTDLIVIQWRELAHLQGPDRQTVRELQREYIEIWAAALLRARPELTLSTAMTMTVSVFGLINSTPFVLRRATPDRVAPVLREVALAALMHSDVT